MLTGEVLVTCRSRLLNFRQLFTSSGGPVHSFHQNFWRNTADGYRGCCLRLFTAMSAALWENALMANRAVVQKWLPTATTNTASQDESVVGCFEGRKQSLEGETEVWQGRAPGHIAQIRPKWQPLASCTRTHRVKILINVVTGWRKIETICVKVSRLDTSTFVIFNSTVVKYQEKGCIVSVLAHSIMSHSFTMTFIAVCHVSRH